MEKRLFLRNVGYEINLQDIQGKESEIIAKVQEDFSIYTRGTHKDYRNADKLCYLDMIRLRLHDDFETWARKYAFDTLDYVFDVSGDSEKLSFEIEFDYEFAEQAFDAGARKFYESNKCPAQHNVLCLVIKAVMDWEE